MCDTADVRVMDWRYWDSQYVATSNERTTAATAGKSLQRPLSFHRRQLLKHRCTLLFAVWYVLSLNWLNGTEQNALLERVNGSQMTGVKVNWLNIA
jgi:hypothetical protein